MSTATQTRQTQLVKELPAQNDRVTPGKKDTHAVMQANNEE